MKVLISALLLMVLPSVASAQGPNFRSMGFGVSDQNNPEMVASKQYKYIHARFSRIIVPWHSGLDADTDYNNRRGEMRQLCNASWKNGVRPQIAFNPSVNTAKYPRVPGASAIPSFRMSLSNIIDDCDNNKSGSAYKSPDIETFNEPDHSVPRNVADIARMWVTAETLMRQRRGGGKVSAFSLTMSGTAEHSTSKPASWYTFTASFLKDIRKSVINPKRLRPTAISLHPYNDLNANTRRADVAMKLFRNNRLYPKSSSRKLPETWMTEISVYHARQVPCFSKVNKGRDTLGNPMRNNRHMWVSQAAYNRVHTPGATVTDAQSFCWSTFPKKVKNGKAIEQWVFRPSNQSRKLFTRSYSSSETGRAKRLVNLANGSWRKYNVTRIYWYDWINVACHRSSESFPLADQEALGAASSTRTPGSESGGCGDNGRALWNSGLFDTNFGQPLPSWSVINAAR